MSAAELLSLLERRASDAAVISALQALNTLARPALDREEAPDQHHDWITVRRRGVELGFVDEAYLRGRPEADLWRDDCLIVQQVYFYGPGRQGITPYSGELPCGLTFADGRETVRMRLAHLGRPRVSSRTDCWDVNDRRWVISYPVGGKALDAVAVKVPCSPWQQEGPRQPRVAVAQWTELFGAAVDEPRLQRALSPLDVAARVQEEEEEGEAREISFVHEVGLRLYLEEGERLKLPAGRGGSGMRLGAVTFFTDRELGSRAWEGELPCGLHFSDDPATLLQKLPGPAEQDEDERAGYAVWHLPEASLHVLYSTVENRLLRVTWMAPGYHRPMPPAEGG